MLSEPEREDDVLPAVCHWFRQTCTRLGPEYGYWFEKVFWPGSLDISIRATVIEATGTDQEHDCASGRICLGCLCSLGISSSLPLDQAQTECHHRQGKED